MTSVARRRWLIMLDSVGVDYTGTAMDAFFRSNR
jgi:hypothetical protein